MLEAGKLLGIGYLAAVELLFGGTYFFLYVVYFPFRRVLLVF